MKPSGTFKTFLSWAAWPGLLTLCTLITAYGFGIGYPVVFFNIAYAFLAISLYYLEQTMPHERVWNENDGQTFANLAHTLLNKGSVQLLVVFSAAIGLADYITPASAPGYSIWPREWPIALQAVLGIYVAEFGLYWVHRLNHEIPLLWRFHAVHHSVTRLWIINTGRFHFVDSLMSIIIGIAILVALGAPMEVLVWLSAITAFIGMLTHCNVEMRFGWLSYIFNTPGLHRWHHSKIVAEGNTNYGENIMLWDQLFGTFFNPHRTPPVDIGISDPMPAGFGQQLAYPFKRRSAS